MSWTRDMLAEVFAADDFAKADFEAWERQRTVQKQYQRELVFKTTVTPHGRQQQRKPDDLRSPWQVLAEIVGEKTGELERRIIALEKENKQLRVDLESLRSSNVRAIRAA